VSTLAALGASFDVASRSELDLCLALGVPAAHISYGNTIKKADDVAYAHGLGVGCFAFDSVGELVKLARHAPGAEVLCRLATTGAHADWPLSRKFGCDAEMAAELLLQARNLGLRPVGITFHVGSQQTEPLEWRAPLLETASVFRRLATHGLVLDTVNIGGGFPACYDRPVPAIDVYADTIAACLHEAFGDAAPRLLLEPGRSLVAEAGIIQAEVVLIARKSHREPTRWVYLDVGKFGGLAETLGESIRYPLRTSRGGELGPVILAGPTCDSADILYEHTPYLLPLDLECGDRLEILSAGAYTASYASVGFNGFPPLESYCL
jgi:ornithine decarboxylase